jgi:hypothetical protein
MNPQEAEHRQQEAESLVEAAREREVCGECGGEGKLHYRVSREMAIDAGDESWEGTPVDIRCERCKGEGVQP